MKGTILTRSPGLFAAIVVALFLFLLGKGLLIEPPAVRAPAEGAFDAARAYGRLERILAGIGPHIADSAADDVVRERILAELRAVGVEPQVRDQVVCNTFAQASTVQCGRVRNIVATIGPAEGRHLLLVTHYDSNTAGPGAADAGIGVASLIEIAHLLRTEALRRPVTILIDEGEESGLLGARAFLDGDPLAAQVDTVLNIEARGVSGPAIMFETSQPNGAAIGAYADGAWRPFANSLSTDIYRLLPNSTDVAEFEERPWAILNFAITGNETRYHTAGDDLVSLSRASLHHMGNEVLGTARAIVTGETEDSAGSASTLIYADFYGLFLVSLPLTIGLILLVIAGAVLAVTVWKRQAFGRPLLTVAAALLVAGLAAFAMDWLVHLLRPADYWRGYPLVTFAGFYALALVAAAGSLWTLGRGVERTRIRSAFWLLFVVLGGAFCLIAPGAAIYFIFPALGAAISALFGRSSGVARFFDCASSLLLLLTFSEVMGLVELTLVDGPYWILAPIAVLAIMPLLIEARPAETETGQGLTLWPAGAVAVVTWIAVLLVPRLTEDRQALFTIEYFRDLGANSAVWAISNKGVPLNERLREMGDWEMAELPYSGRRRWTMPARLVSVPHPSAQVVAQKARADGSRQVRLRLNPNNAEAIALRLPASATLRGAGTGQSVRPMTPSASGAPSWVRCQGRSCDGMLVDLIVGPGPIEAQIISTRFALPPEGRSLVAARPEHARPQYGPNAIVVAAPFRF